MAKTCELRVLLRRFYDLVNQPDKDVEELASEWAGREGELWEAMGRKYGAAKVRQVLTAPSGFSKAPFPTAALALHAEVIAEIVGTSALDERDDKARRMSTRSHLALTALRVLQNVGATAKTHLQTHGGLCAVVDACSPLTTVVAEPGATERSTSTVFVRVDKNFANFARSHVGMAAPPAHVPPRDVAEILRRTKAWRAFVVKGSDAMDRAARDEETTLRAFLEEENGKRGKKKNLARALLERRPSESADLKPQVYGRAAVARLLEAAVEKAAVAGDDENLDRLLEVAASSPGLPAADRDQYATTNERWRRLKDRKQQQQQRQQRKGPLPPPRVPSSSPAKAADAEGHAAVVQMENLATTSGEIETPKAPPTPKAPNTAPPTAPPTRTPTSIVKRPDSERRPPRSVRFVDDDGDDEKAAPEKKSTAVLLSAEERGRGTPEWRRQQSEVLSKRMDRAIWDAFRQLDFDPLLSLLDQGASASYVRLSRETALMAAAYAGRDDVCRKLVALGADPSASDAHGNTAVTLAHTQGHHQLAAVLHGLVVAKVARLSKDHDDDDTRADAPSSPLSTPTRSSKRRRGDDAFPSLPRLDDDDDHRKDIAHQSALATTTTPATDRDDDHAPTGPGPGPGPGLTTTTGDQSNNKKNSYKRPRVFVATTTTKEQPSVVLRPGVSSS